MLEKPFSKALKTLYSPHRSVMRIKPRCTHRRVPGSRLVGDGDGDGDFARCSLKIIFFVTLLATNSVKNRLKSKGSYRSQTTALSYHNNAFFTPRTSPDAEGL